MIPKDLSTYEQVDVQISDFVQEGREMAKPGQTVGERATHVGLSR